MKQFYTKLITDYAIKVIPRVAVTGSFILAVLQPCQLIVEIKYKVNNKGPLPMWCLFIQFWEMSCDTNWLISLDR